MRSLAMIFVVFGLAACGDSEVTRKGKHEQGPGNQLPVPTTDPAGEGGDPGLTGSGPAEPTKPSEGQETLEETVTATVEGFAWRGILEDGMIRLIDIPGQFVTLLTAYEGVSSEVSIGGSLREVEDFCRRLGADRAIELSASAGWGTLALYQYPRQPDALTAIRDSFRVVLGEADLEIAEVEVPAASEFLVSEGGWSNRSPASAQFFKDWSEQGATDDILAFQGEAETYFSVATLCDSFEGSIQLQTVW